jgi:UDP-N-acetylglucosamine 2-epimerase (non-hydrolysing)
VDHLERLEKFLFGFDLIQKKYNLPIIVSTHPRTKSKLIGFNINTSSPNIHFLEPFGFFDFIRLEQNAWCVLSDSGTVQEECAIFGVPNVTIRDVTERPETIECGSNILSGADPYSIEKCVEIVLNNMGDWKPPPEYLVEDVSRTVVKIVTGFYLA